MVGVSHLSERPDDAVVGLALPHESAALHVTGHALYTDDLVDVCPHPEAVTLGCGRPSRQWVHRPVRVP